MPQLDPISFFNSCFLTLFFFWIFTFLFVYILSPLVALRLKMSPRLADVKPKFALKKFDRSSFFKKYVKALKKVNDVLY
jgi:hypothetical protein